MCEEALANTYSTGSQGTPHSCGKAQIKSRASRSCVGALTIHSLFCCIGLAQLLCLLLAHPPKVKLLL
jgi:hypothetical protein